MQIQRCQNQTYTNTYVCIRINICKYIFSLDCQFVYFATISANRKGLHINFLIKFQALPRMLNVNIY